VRHRSRFLRGHDEYFAVLQCHRREELALPGEQAQLAEEPLRAVHSDDPLLLRAVSLDHRHPTGQHDVERLTRFALDEQHLA
jgi:hypothetical protein